MAAGGLAASALVRSSSQPASWRALAVGPAPLAQAFFQALALAAGAFGAQAQRASPSGKSSF